ncbi:hypothetical protein ABZ565_03980 [Streptomyces sp. NPDC016469]|uniref:hypothetical protein n=1 Tax=Streptomyces sp. NPDC016469 TaxID=3157191 RepID=UPI0033FA4739
MGAQLRAFPEVEATADDQMAPIGQARIERRYQTDVSRSVAALHRARAERAAPGGWAIAVAAAVVLAVIVLLAVSANRPAP